MVKALIFCFCNFRFLNFAIKVLSFGVNCILITLTLKEILYEVKHFFSFLSSQEMYLLLCQSFQG